MTWILDEERRMLRDSAQSFLADRAPVSHLRQLRDSADAKGYAPALWAAFGEQGYSATLVPESHGGLGLGVTEAGLLAEQIGHTLAPTPFFPRPYWRPGCCGPAAAPRNRRRGWPASPRPTPSWRWRSTSARATGPTH